MLATIKKKEENIKIKLYLINSDFRPLMCRALTNSYLNVSLRLDLSLIVTDRN